MSHSSVQRILINDDPSGRHRAGEIVTLTPGYARHLDRLKITMRATPENLRLLEQQRETIIARDEEALETARRLASIMEGIQLTIPRSANEQGKLYASIDKREIVQALKEAGHEINRKQVMDLNPPIQTTGWHTAHVRLHSRVTVPVSLNIIRPGELDAAPLFDDAPYDEPPAPSPMQQLADKLNWHPVVILAPTDGEGYVRRSVEGRDVARAITRLIDEFAKAEEITVRPIVTEDQITPNQPIFAVGERTVHVQLSSETNTAIMTVYVVPSIGAAENRGARRGLGQPQWILVNRAALDLR